MAQHSSAGGLKIVDVGDPSNPSSNGQCPIAYAVDVTVSGDFAYVAGYISGFKVVDVSNPANPVIVGSRVCAGNPVTVEVAGDYAYVFCRSGTTLNFEVLDIGDPAAPALAGTFTTTGMTNDLAGIDIKGDYAFVSGAESGLLVIRYTSSPPIQFFMTATILRVKPGEQLWQAITPMFVMPNRDCR